MPCSEERRQSFVFGLFPLLLPGRDAVCFSQMKAVVVAGPVVSPCSLLCKAGCVGKTLKLLCVRVQECECGSVSLSLCVNVCVCVCVCFV